MSKIAVKQLFHARCPTCKGGILKLQGFVLTESNEATIFCVCTKCDSPVTFPLDKVLTKLYTPENKEGGNGKAS